MLFSHYKNLLGKFSKILFNKCIKLMPSSLTYNSNKNEILLKYENLNDLYIKTQNYFTGFIFKNQFSDIILNDKLFNIEARINYNNLRSYQINGIKWLLWAYSNKINVCLSDEMGLGKTIQCLCMLSNFYELHYKNLIKSNIDNISIILTPLSVLHQWKQEIFNFNNLNIIEEI